MTPRVLAVLVVAVLVASTVTSVAYLAASPKQQARGADVTATTTSSGLPASQTTTYTPPGSGPSPAGSVYPTGTIGIEQAVALMKELPSYAQVDASTNTVTFGAQNVDVLILAAMADDAANITGLQPPQYATGDVFMVGGLIDPTLVFQKGANVNFTFVNVDDDMYHNFVLTTLAPPYGYMMMASGGMGPGMMYDFLSAMPLMSPANYQQGYAYVYSYGLTMGGAGQYWYVCTYPGHAQSGMYGQLVVG